MNDNEFREGKIDTGFIERHPELLKPQSVETEAALIAAALSMFSSESISQAAQKPASNWKLFGRRSGLTGSPLA